MSDDVVVEPEDVDEVFATSEADADVVATVETDADVIATVEMVPEASAVVENPADAIATAEPIADIHALAEAIEDIIAEAELTNVEDALLRKLLSLKNYVPEYITLAYATGFALSGSGEPGDAAGDSTKWVGTDEFQEIAQCTVLQPAFRNSGKLEFTITAEFKNPVGVGSGAETMTFELEAGLDYPANAGLPPTFTSIATFTTPAIATGAGTGTLVFTLTLFAEGHKGDAFFQAYCGKFSQNNLTTGLGEESPPFVDRISLDTTEDLVLRWRFKTSVAPDLPDQKFNVTHLDAHLEMPDPFHPYR